MSRLTIIRGVPGSGKTTYAKKNFRCLILEQDMFHERDGFYQWSGAAMRDAVKWCSKTAHDALRLGMDVCVVNTFTKREYVETYRRMAAETGASFNVIRVEGDFENVHSVPPGAMSAMRRIFEDWPGETVVENRNTVA